MPPIRSTGSGPRSTPPTCGPLGGRAHDLLASPVPTPARALRAPRRHPPSAAHDRLLPDLLQAASGRRDILKGALSGSTGAERSSAWIWDFSSTARHHGGIGR